MSLIVNGNHRCLLPLSPSLFLFFSPLFLPWSLTLLPLSPPLFLPQFLSQNCIRFPLSNILIRAKVDNIFRNAADFAIAKQYFSSTWKFVQHRGIFTAVCVWNISSENFFLDTVRPLLSAVLGRTKFWSQKPRINEVRG